jgi:NTP pyrophosphatase (non-canonical NTP hydrolase)
MYGHPSGHEPLPWEWVDGQLAAAGTYRVAVARRALTSAPVELGTLQDLMRDIYGRRDQARGVPATIAWLAEELGELAQAARKGTPDEQRHELGDVLAWLASLANQLDLALDDAVARYAEGCPRCGGTPCRCPEDPARTGPG